MLSLWPRCLEHLEAELPAEDVHAWLKPLQAFAQGEGLTLYAPNAFVVDTVRDRYLGRIRELASHYAGLPTPVALTVGSMPRIVAPAVVGTTPSRPIPVFANKYQKDMQALFDQAKPAPLDFSISYRWRPGQSSVLLAKKK